MVPRSRSLRGVLISLGVVGLMLALVGGGTLWFLTNRYAADIERVSDVFAELNEGARPAPATDSLSQSAEEFSDQALPDVPR
jgi:HAMP domain-containing protein